MKIFFLHVLSNGGQLRFSAPVVAMRIADRAPIVRIPEKVRGIPFPPFKGKKYVTCRPELVTIVE